MLKNCMNFTDVEQAPLINDLNHGPIAYIGARHLILEELEKMLIHQRSIVIMI